MMQTPSPRLTIRPVSLFDVDDLFRIYGDPATHTFNPTGVYPDIAHARTVIERWLAHWQTHAFGNWAISLRDAPQKVIGFGGLTISTYVGININNLGYRFATEAWGQGLATEFSQYTVRYGFEQLLLDEISAIVRPQHQASQQVLLKSGLKYVGEIQDIANAEPSLMFHLSHHDWLNSKT